MRKLSHDSWYMKVHQKKNINSYNKSTLKIKNKYKYWERIKEKLSTHVAFKRKITHVAFRRKIPFAVSVLERYEIISD